MFTLLCALRLHFIFCNLNGVFIYFSNICMINNLGENYKIPIKDTKIHIDHGQFNIHRDALIYKNDKIYFYYAMFMKG